MSRFGAPLPWYRRWGRIVPKLPTPPLTKRGPKSRLYRRQSQTRVRLTPVATVLLACIMPLILPMIPSMPLLPPLGFMVFLAWRLIRPELWPLWVGFPLGLFDDICNGQPFGSGAMLWSVTTLGLELWEQRQIGRDYLMDWVLAGVSIALLLVGGLFMVGLSQTRPPLSSVFPQLIISLLVFPIVMRGVAAADRWRLAR